MRKSRFLEESSQVKIINELNPAPPKIKKVKINLYDDIINKDAIEFFMGCLIKQYFADVVKTEEKAHLYIRGHNCFARLYDALSDKYKMIIFVRLTEDGIEVFRIEYWHRIIGEN